MRPVAFVVAALVSVVAGCGNSGSSSDSMSPAQPVANTRPATARSTPTAVRSATVDIASFKFAPPVVAVRRGGRVRWTNSDSASHTATADDRSFDTQALDKGASRTITFGTAGTFAYHCDFHPFMKAAVVVR